MWQPNLQPGPTPLYERLVEAMQRDIQAGLLTPGTRLPPQRDLAFKLKISVGSVTRAYTEAERLGLLRAHVGRGSFISGTAPDRPDPSPTEEKPDGYGLIDLRRNVPPAVPMLPMLNATVSELAAHGALAPALHYAPATGLSAVRQAGAIWLAQQHGLTFAPENLIQCNGGQHGIALVFSALCRPGDVILCESSTFYGARVAADHLGLKLHGVAMDHEGLLPEALEQAVAETGSRLLFIIPTLHNPTTRTMSDQRRQQIAAIARARDLLILEDDAYYAYSERPKQLAHYAPERTLYLASLSKGICPGLRLAFLALPAGMVRERFAQAIHALGYSPPTLNALIFKKWVESGQIYALAHSIQAETRARRELARTILGDLMAPSGSISSPHVWLPLPALEAERIAARLLRVGVDVTPPDAFAICPQADTGLRLCLGTPRHQDELKHALMITAEVIYGHSGLDQERII